MSAPDDKQNKLSTLTQDVIAVGNRPAAAPLRTQERRSIPSTQDVFRVQSEPEPAKTAAPRAAMPAPVAAPATTSPVTWMALGVALVAMGVALYLAGRPVIVQPAAVATAPVATAPVATAPVATAPVATAPAATPAETAEDAGLAGLREELRKASERVRKLEQQMATASAVAAAPASAAPAPTAATTLQTSAALREIQNRLDALSNDQQRIAAQIADIRAQSSAAAKDAHAAQVRSEQLGARVAILDSSQKAAPVPAVSPETQAQLKTLGQKTDKMANDIRQLYRLLESR